VNGIFMSDLRENLSLCEPELEPAEALTRGARYLFDAMYVKLLAGQTVRIGDLDFDRFDCDDLREISLLYEERDRENRKLHSFLEVLDKAPCVPRPCAFL